MGYDAKNFPCGDIDLERWHDSLQLDLSKVSSSDWAPVSSGQTEAFLFSSARIARGQSRMAAGPICSQVAAYAE